MAEIAFRPDEKLARLEEQLRTTKDPAKAKAIQDQISTRTQELMQSGKMPAVGVGGEGYFTPQLNVYSATDVQNRANYERQEALKKELAGKVQLLPQGEPGVYRAVKFNADGTTTDISQGDGNKLTFFDASGNPLSAAQVAATATGQSYAQAGWDIGFGAGDTGGVAVTGKKTGTFGQYGQYNEPVVNTSNITNTGNVTPTGLTSAQAKSQSAFEIFRGFLNQYGLGALAADVEKYKLDGLSDDELLIRLRTESPAYKRRFAANEARTAKGLRALSEAEYIGLEDQYQDVMRRYGLPETYYTRGEMGRQEGFEKFLAGDVSPVELEDRIQTAYNRVINANPEVGIALRTFYPGITNGDILAYTLDPDKALNEIQRKITAAEIGGAAVQAGLTTNEADADYLARYGVTKEQAQQGYRTISGYLPRAQQLSSIYGKQVEGGPYTQASAEREVFNVPGAAEEERKRLKITQLEQAAFSGQSGLTGGALGRERAGQF